MVIYDVVLLAESEHWALLRSEGSEQVVIAKFREQAKALHVMRAWQAAADETLGR
ncbi:MAG: hypothetical protein ACJ740_06425 [Gaiellales bacterium]